MHCRAPHLAWLVVSVAVREHPVEVGDAVLRRAVEVGIEAFFNRTHVHRMFDDLVIILTEAASLSLCRLTHVKYTKLYN